MNNSRILIIKNAKPSGYYFYMNLNIWGDFQICISVPLTYSFFLQNSASLTFCKYALNISKSFDRVWDEGLLYKVETVGISGDLLNLFQSFLSNRYQKISLNGRESNWALVKAEVPQGSILSPLLVFGLHKWSFWWFRIASKTSCRWHFTIFYWKVTLLISHFSEQWLDKCLNTLINGKWLLTLTLLQNKLKKSNFHISQ